MRNKFEKECTIFLVRHGQTNFNLQKIAMGHLQVPLNYQGRQEAKKAVKIFKKNKFHVCYSSDLIRAVETAEIIAQVHKLEINLTKDLRERYLGRLQGKSTEKRPLRLQKLLNKYYSLTPDKRWHKKPFREWETNAQLIGRAFTFLRAVALKHAGQRVLIITHGGVIRFLLAHLGYYSKAEADNYKMKNLGYVVLQSDGITFKIKRIVGLKYLKLK